MSGERLEREEQVAEELRYGRPQADPDAETVLELDGVTKRYGSTTVIDDLSLDVREGELLTLLGPSGCGKTTTLRLIAGLERPSGGEIRLNGRPVTGEQFEPPEVRDVGVVFQEFALFPHLTARENIAFGLTDMEEEARESRVDDLLELVGLVDHGGHALQRGAHLRLAADAVAQPVGDVLAGDAQGGAVLHQADVVDVRHLGAAHALVDPAHHVAEDALGIVLDLAQALGPVERRDRAALRRADPRRRLAVHQYRHHHGAGGPVSESQAGPDGHHQQRQRRHHTDGRNRH